MAQSALGNVLRYLHKVLAIQEFRDLGDGQLLERFHTHRDESAFAALMQRHGTMVLSVGRRVLGNFHEAEDIFRRLFLSWPAEPAQSGERDQ